MSKLREEFSADDGDLKPLATGDLKPWAVFTQQNRGDSHVFAGWVDAKDEKMAVQFAKEHYGQDQECVNLWVVPREAITATEYEKDLIWRLTDQTYRLARGYSKLVRDKWKKIREEKDIKEYEKEDLKESF